VAATALLIGTTKPSMAAKPISATKSLLVNSAVVVLICPPRCLWAAPQDCAKCRQPNDPMG